jgi:hypothetical protein
MTIPGTATLTITFTSLLLLPNIIIIIIIIIIIPNPFLLMWLMLKSTLQQLQQGAYLIPTHFSLVTVLIQGHHQQSTVTKEAAPKCVNTMLLIIKGNVMRVVPVSHLLQEEDCRHHRQCLNRTSDSSFIHHQKQINFMVGREIGFHNSLSRRITTARSLAFGRDISERNGVS